VLAGVMSRRADDTVDEDSHKMMFDDNNKE